MLRSLDGFWLLLRWQWLRQRQTVVLVAAIQVFLAVGVVYGLSYLLPHVDAASALYLTTGAPTLTLLLLGLTVVPAEVALARASGHHEYISTLPVGRLAPPLAEVAFWLAASLPGMALSVVIATARFRLHLHPVATLVPAVLLVALTASAVGYALAASVRPQVVQQMTSFISVVLLLFSPVNFPISRLPGWLQDVQRVLPVTYMADVVRYSLTRQSAAPGRAFAVLAAWCVASLAITYRVTVRRR